MELWAGRKVNHADMNSSKVWILMICIHCYKTFCVFIIVILKQFVLIFTLIVLDFLGKCSSPFEQCRNCFRVDYCSIYKFIKWDLGVIIIKHFASLNLLYLNSLFVFLHLGFQCTLENALRHFYKSEIVSV